MSVEIGFQRAEGQLCDQCDKPLEYPFVLWTFNRFNLCLCLECGKYISLHLASDSVKCELMTRQFNKGHKYCNICNEIKPPFLMFENSENLCSQCKKDGFAEN